MPTELIVTASPLLEKVTRIMREHIGRKNSLTAGELFKKVYGTIINEYKAFFYYCNLQRAMTSLRKHSDCFIVSEKIKGTSQLSYYVVKTYDEADQYCKRVDKKIKGMHKIKEKCIEAVDKQKWKNL